MTRIAAADFEALFADTTRAMLNWPRLRREKWSASLEVLTTRRDLGRLWLPWPRGDKQLLDRGAKLMRVADVPALLPSLDSDRRQAILKLAGSLDRGRAGSFALPAVRATRGRRLLVDGCHRACALLLAGGDFSIALFVLEGTADARTIIDLDVL